MIPQQLKDTRKKMFDKMEQRLKEGRRPEDSLFYYHPSEDRIVLSHALFWVMTKSIKGRIAKEKFFLLLRQYQEEMLEAYLTESDYFSELLRYCNIIYETLPVILSSRYNGDKETLKLMSISIVTGGYGGDMADSQANELLDDMDFYNNKVKCPKIEQMLPMLNQMVREQLTLIGL